MLAGLRRHLSYANVMATVALFIALSGGAYAATQLAKNSVGTKQLKKNAVTSAKVKNHSLTNADVNVNKLGKVPSAARADSAITATSATTATSAATATTVAPPEDWREVGTAGQPPFTAGASNAISAAPDQVNFETVAFFKDREGVVHLKGAAIPSSIHGQEIFNLPAGYRPRARRLLEFPVVCRATSPCTDETAVLQILGGGFGAADDGKVVTNTTDQVSLEGITFRAAG
jgi:hypothetical protein